MLAAKELKRQGVDVCVAYFYGENAFAAELADANVETVRLTGSAGGSLLTSLRAYRQFLRGRQPDIVFAYMPLANIVAATARILSGRKAPRVAFGVRASAVSAAEGSLARRGSALLEMLLSRVADSVVCNSEAGLKAITAAGWRVDKGVIIANGIDTVAFAPPSTDRRARMRQQLGYSDEHFVVVVPARYDEFKDHDLLLHAIRRAVLELPTLRVYCCGGGERRRTELSELAETLGIGDHVSLAGRTNSVLDVYHAADCLCLPSKSEGFPNVIGEGMACALPCVATDVGDVRAILGDVGLVTEPGNADTLADALIDAAGGRSRGLGVRARALVLESYSVERLGRNMIEHARHLLYASVR